LYNGGYHSTLNVFSQQHTKHGRVFGFSNFSRVRCARALPTPADSNSLWLSPLREARAAKDRAPAFEPYLSSCL
jgi:hypothetical protein